MYTYVNGLWNASAKTRSLVGMVSTFWYLIIYKKVIKFDFWVFSKDLFKVFLLGFLHLFFHRNVIHFAAHLNWIIYTVYRNEHLGVFLTTKGNGLVKCTRQYKIKLILKNVYLLFDFWYKICTWFYLFLNIFLMTEDFLFNKAQFQSIEALCQIWLI